MPRYRKSAESNFSLYSSFVFYLQKLDVLSALFVPKPSTPGDFLPRSVSPIFSFRYLSLVHKSGFLPLLEIREIRENWKAFFHSGKSQGIWQFVKKSGNFDHPIFFLYFILFCLLGLCPLTCTLETTLTSQ